MIPNVTFPRGGIIFLFIFSILGCHILAVLSALDEGLLVKHLLDNYKRTGSKYARPVKNFTDALVVRHGLTIQRIETMDPYYDRVTLNVWENFVSIIVSSEGELG